MSVYWDVYNKLKKVALPNKEIYYQYDPNGNRTLKINVSPENKSIDYYVRDPQGNIFSVYNRGASISNTLQSEINIYGSNRLGSIQVNRQGFENIPYTNIQDAYRYRLQKHYELSNHLGNVLTTISDRKLGNNPTSNLVEYYTAEILSASDYDPFGMQLDDRKVSSSTLRYGFNGKENDNDIKGDGNQQDYGMRIYDPRVGRFLSVDPLTKSYPELTPYQFASNSPVSGIDLDGKEFLIMITPQYTSGNTVVSSQISEVDLTKSVNDIEFLAHHIGAENMKNIINNYKQEDRNKLNFIMEYNHESAKFEYTGNILAPEIVGEKIDKYAYGKFGPFTFHSDGWYENDEDGLKHGLQRINDVANVMTSAATLGEGAYLINSTEWAAKNLIAKSATYTSMGLAANYLAEQATGTNLLNNTLTKLIGEDKAKTVEIGLNLYSGGFGSWDAIYNFKKNGGISPGAIGDMKGTIETTSKILSNLFR